MLRSLLACVLVVAPLALRPLAARPQPDAAAEAALVDAVSAYVERYYAHAQSVVAEEAVTLQPLNRDLTADGFARRLVYELRVEWDPSADGDREPATVVRHLVSVNGRPPREGDEPKCSDPRAVSPEPLVMLLPQQRGRFRFAHAGRGRVDGRPALLLDYGSLVAEPPKTAWRDDCVSIDLPGRTRGRVWADPHTAEILRLDEHLVGQVDIPVPPKQQRTGGALFMTVERADTSIVYAPVRFSDPDETVMLPARVESLTVVRNASPSYQRITQRFSNYRRFVTGSRIVE